MTASEDTIADYREQKQRRKDRATYNVKYTFFNTMSRHAKLKRINDLVLFSEMASYCTTQSYNLSQSETACFVLLVTLATVMVEIFAAKR